MISFKELIKDKVLSDVTHTQQLNLEELLKRINIVRAAWGKPMVVTSGLRTMQEHLRIYSEKGITDRSKIPMASAHLQGMAVDIADPDGALKLWLTSDRAGISALERADLYCEEGTVGWLHFQARRPKSGNRWFNP